MPETGFNAYSRATVVTSNGRDLEANVLTKAAQRLMDCQQNWDKDGHKDRLDYALRSNQKIWTIIQTAVSSDDNPLPIDIKNNILSLSIFVDKRIIEIMAAPKSEKLNALIQININIAEGLRTSNVQKERQTQAQPNSTLSSIAHLHLMG
jgi:flagellar biosynthesis activator protein FlaF